MLNANSEPALSQRWQELYVIAMSLRDEPGTIRVIGDAETAMLTRLQELYQGSGPEAEVEREALDDALYVLYALRSSIVNAIAA